jgi:hypothetical protein
MPAILLVDEDVESVGILGELLARQSWRVIVATSAGDAVSAVRRTRIGCALISTNLSGAMRLALETLFRDDPALRETPCFFMEGGPSGGGCATVVPAFVCPLPRTSQVHLLGLCVRPRYDLAWLKAIHDTPRN